MKRLLFKKLKKNNQEIGNELDTQNPLLNNMEKDVNKNDLFL